MAWRLFYSYSHKDSELRERLATHLAPLKRQKSIIEWHDRKIQPGADWNTEISQQLQSADLILLLISADFLASEYCFGVEMEEALARLKRGEVKVVPVLLRPCLWEDSRFSGLQMVPRDAKPITQWPSTDEALTQVAKEIRELVSEPPPSASKAGEESLQPQRSDLSLELVRNQLRSYARLYERTRQRMRSSDERTERMEQIFQKMQSLATASYPLLDELAASPSPGERLATVAILQVFATERYLPLLVKLIATEKPFVGHRAAKALQFAVGALDPHFYPQLSEAIRMAREALTSAGVGAHTDRQTVLREAEKELGKAIEL
jgi:TIR domain